MRDRMYIYKKNYILNISKKKANEQYIFKFNSTMAKMIISDQLHAQLRFSVELIRH